MAARSCVGESLPMSARACLPADGVLDGGMWTDSGRESTDHEARRGRAGETDRQSACDRDRAEHGGRSDHPPQKREWDSSSCHPLSRGCSVRAV